MVKIEHLYKKFGDHVLFNDFSMKVNDGEFVVFRGVSGCGKTTLLNMIGAIEPVTSGRIVVDGYDITNQINHRKYFAEKVGFLFQNYALVENKSVEKNLKMISEKYRTEFSIEQALKEVGMSGKEKTKVYQLSGGEQQRIALARLILKKCSVILADEPTGSLDSGNAGVVISLLKQLNKKGKTVIMVTHDNSVLDNEMRIINL